MFMFSVLLTKAQVFIQRTSDSTFKLIGEAGLVTGSYTYDQFAPDFYLEGFRVQLKKGIYYRQEYDKGAFRLSFVGSSGSIHHIARQYMEVKDTINLDGQWKNRGLQIGFEKFLYSKNGFSFYGGFDAVYRKHKFSGAGSSMFDELTFQQKQNSYGVGAEMFIGARFDIGTHFKISLESAYSILNIHEHIERNYAAVQMPSSVINSNHFTIEPSPFNRISIGYKF